MFDDAIQEVKLKSGIIQRPDCEAPYCDNPKRGALVLFCGKWVCGHCAMKKHEETNMKFWG